LNEKFGFSCIKSKDGRKSAGGTILTIPNWLPTLLILFMYFRGSLNSSEVGWNVGASGMLMFRPEDFPLFEQDSSMDTDDIFSSSSSRSASPLKQDSSAVTKSNQSATFNDKDQTFIPSSFTDDPVLVTASSHKESTESSADRSSIGSKKDDLSSSSATLLLGARQFFKDSLVHIPDETIPNFEKHRVYIVELASFFQNGLVMSDTLLSLMIVQHSASEMSELVKLVLQAANSDQVQEDEIRSKIDKLATWEYYGVEVDGIPSNDEVGVFCLISKIHKYLSFFSLFFSASATV
jgi:hypothetical protein